MRRVIFYLFHDRDGIVDDYVPFKLTALRAHADHIFVVVNGDLDESGRAKLEAVSDTLLVRANVGFDVGAFIDAFAHFGALRLADYDELVLMNSTFFGPIYPFSEVFGRMDATDVDFWGISAHKLVDPNPFANTTGVLPRHLQTHWLAVRKSVFTSLEWSTFWRRIPPLVTYDDVVLNYEARFTQYFERAGFTWLAAWSDEDYPTDHAIFESAPLMLADRCPILKRRQFFHSPMFLERNAIIGRRVLQEMERSDYPTDLIWQNVARTAEPRNLYTNFSLLEILPEDDHGWLPESPPRLAVLAHLVHENTVDEVLAAVRRIPVPYDLVVTTTSTAEPEIRAALARRELAAAEVRVSDDEGGDLRALLVDSRDVLTSDAYDLVCRLHTLPEAVEGESANAVAVLKEHLLDNVVSSPGFVMNVIRLFADHRTLGMAFPPIVNIGNPNLGHAWLDHQDTAVRVAREIGVTTVFDPTTPVAPYGTMFWARPEALRKMVDRQWTSDDYSPERYDGALAPTQERLLAYTALDAGFHVRSILNPDWASINYTFLEYKLQKVSSLLPAKTQEQIEYIRRVRQESGVLLALAREVDKRYPRVARAARPGYGVLRQRRLRRRA